MRRSPLQNRVAPSGDILADPARGLFMGNRGILHDENQTLGHARWRHNAWIICKLVWKDWHRKVMSPNAYTELFFLDEATALAAGHRPCALCRRGAYNHYRTATGHSGSAASLDAKLHSERAVPRVFRQRRHHAALNDLPDGTMILDVDGPALLLGGSVLPFTMAGYGSPRPRPQSGHAVVLTPETSVAALRAGYQPKLHPSAP